MIYWVYLSLDMEAVFHGQIWRLVTFLMYPPALGTWVLGDIFFGVIALFMYHSLGLTLERVWGAFRFNVFFFMGVIGQILAALVGYVVFHESYYITTGFLNFSIFLAFALCCAVFVVYGDTSKGKMAGHSGNRSVCIQLYKRKRKYQM